MSRLVRAYQQLAIKNPAAAYLFAVLCVVTALLIRILLEEVEQGVVPFATLFPAVLVSAVLGGAGRGGAALALSTAFAWMLFIPPTYAFGFSRPVDLVNMALFVLSGGLILVVGATLRAAVDRYEDAFRRAEAGERRLRIALEAGRLGVAWFDIARRVGGWSEAVAQMLGLPVTKLEMTYDEWLALVHPDDRTLAEGALRKALADPDGFYHAEYRVRRPDGSVRTFEFRGAVSRDAQGRPVRLDGVTGDVTERRRGEERQRVLMNELNHRVKNTLALVQALVRQTARSADPALFERSFTERLLALAKTHDLLTEAQWDGVPLRDLIRAEVMPYDPDGARVMLDGPHLLVPAPQVTPLGLVVHELTTNAAKYGALSGPRGVVRIGWSLESAGSSPELQLTWHEEGGPPVTQPERTGFGSRLIDRTVDGELRGTKTLAFGPEGFACELRIPMPSGSGRGTF